MTMQTTELTTALTPNASAEAVVDLGAIGHNVRVLREHAGSAQVMAVVKADGYGHGATPVARAALAAGAAELGVATIDEALALRADGITAPVLAWLHPRGTDFAPALQADVGVALSSMRQLSELLDAAGRTGTTATPSGSRAGEKSSASYQPNRPRAPSFCRRSKLRMAAAGSIIAARPVA